jgi:hypothetical protein
MQHSDMQDGVAIQDGAAGSPGIVEVFKHAS